MAGEASKSQTIVIKRIKKGGHGHHGGAWKIAYADFVTAMMAFFLLMWLLSATTEDEKEELSKYFSQPVEVALFGETGAGTSSILDGGSGASGSAADPKAAEQAKVQLVASLRSERERADLARLERLRAKVEDAMISDPKLEESLSQLKLDIESDGLRIQIFDQDNRPMFDSGSAIARPQMRTLLRQLGSVLAQVPNRVALEGHTDAVPFPGEKAGYSNWELSSDRANASRRELVAGGLPADRVMRVEGLASTELLDGANPKAPTNRRIVIIVMTLEAEDEFLRNAEKASRLVDVVPGGSDEASQEASDPAGGAHADAAATEGEASAEGGHARAESGHGAPSGGHGAESEGGASEGAHSAPAAPAH